MKVCTFNVNSIKAREELLLKWLEKRNWDIDILCLQELKQSADKFPYDKLADIGYHCEVSGQSRYNGVAVCSKLKPQDVSVGFGSPYWDEQKRIIRCRAGDITVINVYVPHGDLRGESKYTYKQRWYEYFLDYLQTNFSPQEPLVIVGDFNVAATDIDVYDAQILHDTIGTMPEERRQFQALLDWGLEDSYRYLYHDIKAFTWWSYIGGAIWDDKGMRIDYILCTKPMAKKLESAEVDLWPRRRRTPTPSDHAPLLAEFKL